MTKLGKLTRLALTDEAFVLDDEFDVCDDIYQILMEDCNYGVVCDNIY